MIKYYKLFNLLQRKKMKKTDLLEIPISSKTLAKLSKGEYVGGEIIDKICLFLNCQPNDIMEVFEEVERKKEDGTTEIALIKTSDQDREDLEFILDTFFEDKDSSYKKIRKIIENSNKPNTWHTKEKIILW